MQIMVRKIDEKKEETEKPGLLMASLWHVAMDIICSTGDLMTSSGLTLRQADGRKSHPKSLYSMIRRYTAPTS